MGAAKAELTEGLTLNEMARRQSDVLNGLPLNGVQKDLIRTGRVSPDSNVPLGFSAEGAPATGRRTARPRSASR